MFTHELSISNHQSDNQQFFLKKSKPPLTRIIDTKLGLHTKIFFLQQLEKAIKHGRILHIFKYTSVHKMNIFLT